MAYQSFYDLNAWKLARRFKIKVYEVVKKFPVEEKFDLAGQLRRAARSVPANIAEGHGRKTPKDEIRFCITARGSLAETLNHLIDAFDCGYIDKEALAEIKSEWDELRRTLLGYIAYLQTKLPSPDTSTGSTVLEDAISYAAEYIEEEDVERFIQNLQ